MSGSRLLLASASGLVLALALGGCTYDYLNNRDTVGYHAGDAVKANLATSTVNPAKSSVYKKNGLGRNGDVGPDEADTGTPGSGSATGTAAPVSP